MQNIINIQYAEGLEEAEVHWPGKGKVVAKVWRCVILDDTSGNPELVDTECTAPSAKPNPLSAVVVVDVDAAGGRGEVQEMTQLSRAAHTGLGRWKWQLEDLEEREHEIADLRGRSEAGNKPSSKPTSTSGKPKRVRTYGCQHLYGYLAQKYFMHALDMPGL